MDTLPRFICWLFLLCLSPACLHAELGAASLTTGHSVSIKSSQAISSAKPSSYEIKKIITQDDIEIHEYLTRSGLVFGVAWRGESKPDLAPLLGNFFGRYQTALSQLTSGRTPVAIQSSDFVLQTGGRMNDFFGLAFLPTLAPQGVSINDIK